MGYTLNVDHWDWVDPETQKVTRLRRGDEVPANVLDQEGVDKDELCKGVRPLLIKGDDESARQTAGAPPASAIDTQQARSESPKVVETNRK